MKYFFDPVLCSTNHSNTSPIQYSIIITLLLCLSPWLHANIEQQRENFLKAEKALNKGKKSEWQHLQKKLLGYPLYADLLFKQAIRNINKTTNKQAKKNLDALKNTPLYNTYRKSWLRRLINKQKWQQYIDLYQPGLGTRYQCHYAQALYQTNKPEKALPVATKLWLVGKSQPKYCDPVFKEMKKNGQLTNALIWQRIELAIQKGKSNLVKYLKKSLSTSEQKTVNEWLKIRYQPERAFNKKYTQSSSPRHRKMLLYGIKRMALFEPDRAQRKWRKIHHKVTLSHEDKQNIEQHLARHMTRKHMDGAIEQHQRVSAPNRKTLESGIRAALRQQDWQTVGNFIQRLEKMETLSERWQYWKAIQAEKTGQQIIAANLYHLLASGRGYYNFLAADQINTTYQFNHKPLQYDKDEIKELTNDYNVRRTHELYLLDRIPKARHEWRYLIRNHGDTARQKLAYIQKQWGWHSQAILTISTADYYDDLSLRFPVIYRHELETITKKNNLDTAWIMALMRQESAFQPDAHSPSGARGLMQIMPETGRYVARLLKQKRPRISDLYKPETSIKLGIYYLEKNLNQFNNNKVVATAAYNAGPNRVSKWLPNHHHMDADIWAETIPLKETRDYVQRILSYASIYDYIIGYDLTRLKERMQGIQNINGTRQTANNP